jgi:hypothetical protein
MDLADPSQVRRWREAQRKWQQRTGWKKRAEQQEPRVPEAVINDRNRRLAMGSTLMGDPLPGYSALDRKMRRT